MFRPKYKCGQYFRGRSCFYPQGISQIWKKNLPFGLLKLMSCNRKCNPEFIRLESIRDILSVKIQKPRFISLERMWRVWKHGTCQWEYKMVLENSLQVPPSLNLVLLQDSQIPFLGISVHFSTVTQSCLTLCDPMNPSTPGLPVRHHLPEFTQPHVLIFS